MYTLYRRLVSWKANNAGNSHAEHTSNEYQMSSENNTSRHYSTVQPVASAPAQSTSATQPADNGRMQPRSSTVDVVKSYS